MALPPGAVVDGEVVEGDVVADALRELWGQAGLRRRTVAVGLASQRVTVRQIDLPDMPEAELADAVRLQAQDQLPIPVDEALLDHVVVGRYPAGNDRQNVRVLLVAAEREMVDRLLTAVTAAKLRPALVDLDAFALVRSLSNSPSPATSAWRQTRWRHGAGAGDQVELVVDIGAMVTKIVVHRAGTPLFVRMVGLGGDAATRQLQTVLDLSWAEAEKAKLDASAALAGGAELDPDDERARVLSSAVQRVITEVRDSLDFFHSQHDDVEVRRVVLSGGASLAPDLIGRLHDALDLPVGPGDPLRGLDRAHAPGATADAPGRTGPVHGGADRAGDGTVAVTERFNLLPARYVERMAERRSAGVVAAALVGLMAVLGVVSVAQSHRLGAAQSGARRGAGPDRRPPGSAKGPGTVPPARGRDRGPGASAGRGHGDAGVVGGDTGQPRRRPFLPERR